MARAHQSVTDFDALTDTDTAGVQDGDGYRWDATAGELVPARIEVFHGEVADEAAMLALAPVSPGDEVFRQDDGSVYKLVRLPGSTLANWLVTATLAQMLTWDSTAYTVDSTTLTMDQTVA